MENIQTNLESSLRGRFKVTHVQLSIPGLPRSFENYRMVQMTDIHYGPATRRAIVEEAFSIAQGLSPDLIVLTGDFIVAGMTGFRHRYATRYSLKLFRWKEYRRKVRVLTRELGTLISDLRAKDGVFGVLGNHDHIEGLGSVLRQMPQELRWLTNDATQIQREGDSITLSGIDDTRKGKPDLRGTLEKHRDGAFRILLSHNPDIVLDENRALLGDVDLILCGHTHGGQIRIPGWGPIRTATKQKDHVLGLTKFGTTLIYTSAGVGNGGLPLRLFCPPEVVLFELKSA